MHDGRRCGACFETEAKVAGQVSANPYVAAVLAGALAAAFRAPLFAALFTLTMVQAETAPVVTVAVLIGFILSVLLGQRAAHAAAAKAPPPVPQAPQLQP